MQRLRLGAGTYAGIMLGCALSGLACGQPITVKLVNGKTGKPRSKVRVYIVLSDPKQQHLLDLKTDQYGAVRFDSGDSKTFQVRPVGEVACGEQHVGAPVGDYSVDTVMSRGTVTTNDCGQLPPQQKPGQLTYFSRPATWWELFRL